MKRIKALHGYTIYQATERDKERDALTSNYYIYFSSDIRDYGVSNSEYDWESDTIEGAIEYIESCGDYATIREELEAECTAVTFEDIEAEEKRRAKKEAEAIAKTQELEKELERLDEERKMLAKLDFTSYRALVEIESLQDEERRYCERYCQLNPDDRARREHDRDLIIMAYTRAHQAIKDIYLESLRAKEA